MPTPRACALTFSRRVRGGGQGAGAGGGGWRANVILGVEQGRSRVQRGGQGEGWRDLCFEGGCAAGPCGAAGQAQRCRACNRLWRRARPLPFRPAFHPHKAAAAGGPGCAAQAPWRGARGSLGWWRATCTTASACTRWWGGAGCGRAGGRGAAGRAGGRATSFGPGACHLVLLARTAGSARLASQGGERASPWWFRAAASGGRPERHALLRRAMLSSKQLPCLPAPAGAALGGRVPGLLHRRDQRRRVHQRRAVSAGPALPTLWPALGRLALC